MTTYFAADRAGSRLTVAELPNGLRRVRDTSGLVGTYEADGRHRHGDLRVRMTACRTCGRLYAVGTGFSGVCTPDLH